MIETLMKCQAMLKEHGIYLSKITVDVDKYEQLEHDLKECKDLAPLAGLNIAPHTPNYDKFDKYRSILRDLNECMKMLKANGFNVIHEGEAAPDNFVPTVFAQHVLGIDTTALKREAAFMYHRQDNEQKPEQREESK